MTSDSSPLEALRSRALDQGHCVTVNADGGRSRAAVAANLAQLASENASLKATYVHMSTMEDICGEDVVPTTVFSLSAEPSDTLYALSTGEGVATGHARDLSKWRDQAKDGTLMFEATTDIIAPSDAVKRDMLESTRAAPVEEATPAAATSTTAMKKKATTAASFFGNKKPATVKSKATNMKVAATSKPKAAATPTKPKIAAKPIDEEKENQTKAASVGRVDDFVGDEEDDEDDVPVVASSPAQPPVVVDDGEQSVKPRKSPKKPHPIVHGAMDDFVSEKAPTTPANNTSQPPRKKKVKKTIQKTTMDDKGYIHTEMVEVWEEVDDDEPVVKKASPPKKATAAKKPSQMKQGSLMGFFKKK